MEDSRALLKFKPHSTFLIAGPSKIGKTYWLTRFLKNVHCLYEEKDVPQKIYWFYSAWQPLYVELEDSLTTPITFIEGLPSKEDVMTLTDGETHIFFVLDDLCSEAINYPDVCRMFKRDSHHRALSVAITYQNLYEQGKKSKSNALSTQYLILFKNLRQLSDIFIG